MLLRVFTVGLRLLAAYLTTTGVLRLVSNMASTALRQWRYRSRMIAHVNRGLFGVLLMFLWLTVPLATGGALPLEVMVMVSLVAACLMASAILGLAQDIGPALVRNCPTFFGGLLLLLGLGVHVAKGGQPAWEFAVTVSLMVAYRFKGTFQLSRDTQPFGIILLFLGLCLHIITVGIERGVMQFAMQRESSELLQSSVASNIQQYLEQWKGRLQRYKH